MAGFQTLTKDELEHPALPDLTAVYLALPGDFTNGAGQPINAAEVVRELAGDLDQLLAVHNAGKVRLGDTLFETFFVPDLWHVAKGRAKSLPKEEGEQLWAFGILANRVATTLYRTKEMHTSHNYPGSLYREPLDQPNYREE